MKRENNEQNNLLKLREGIKSDAPEMRLHLRIIVK